MAESIADLGLVSVDGEVVFILLQDGLTGRFRFFGEFPHCRMYADKRAQCRSTIHVTDQDGTSEERCTREARHEMPHVKHLGRGRPALAWRPEHTNGSNDA